MKPLIALVGRPNVGKSTLFNRILRQRSAIVDSTPGVTRDRHIADGEWQGKQFLLMDTGGYNAESDLISKAMLEQTLMAIRDADIIVFVTDARAGLSYEDLELGKLLKRNFQNKQLFFAVNKVESPQLIIEAESFISTGFTKPYFISAKDGSGVADMLDDILETFPELEDVPDEEDSAISLAIVGRPNVGKSSFVNALLNSNRHIVSSIAGTTRDAIDSRFTRKKQEFVLIDTAGLRKRTKIDRGIEYYSSLRTEKALERCDVALVMLDATPGIEKQDLKIINMAVEKKKGALLLVNKWDLIEKDSKTSKIYEDNLRSSMGNLGYIPVLFISALTKKNLYRAIDTAQQISESRSRKISTSALNRFLEETLQQKHPSSRTGKELKIKYMTQIESHWPIFAFFCNDPELVQTNFIKFLEKKLRETFSLEGVPISLRFMQK
ncbi:ribosome biogenesis GTPase Der [Chlorobium sp. BLA1]|uniref:ribosome biogenesis GTPase Der n=1 Tax=Candidatus Chlorobium masyuteum TaxID=2716876 RepID=UPI0014205F35|nr:ribosome biogenesis GTPase Der [Candidatus Chlorobium masyuteum]NHQ60061.1 ribosome biogenesis GTPase Der [Candidatus Chlorobium masyuteum]NTU44666.1 ribosome biogenesis GTPase Der [Chlorobiaceae bacterium]